MRFHKSISIVLFSIVFMYGCGSSEEPSPTRVNIPDGKGYELLSQYNFFKGDISELEPNMEEGVIPYDLNTPLFSDYALKKRYVYVPEGSSIPYDPENTLDLPVGSVLIKHFYYKNSDGSNKYIETRLMLHQSDGWKPETYIWEDDMSDARRTVVGKSEELNVNVNGEDQVFNYLVPNQNQCKNCHGLNGKIYPIGPMVPNLNKDYDYPDGTSNQIDTWIARGILQPGKETEDPKWPKMEEVEYSLDSRARAYLAVNCSSCHRLEGSAANSGLYLEYFQTDSLSIGFWKTPVAAGDGSGGFRYVIEPGNADESILLHRMKARDVEVRMPEIGRELVHEEGIELIREWINNMN